MEQQIRFCTTSDGVRIAYSVAGEGKPLVLCPGIYGQLDLDWEHPWRRVWFEGLAEACQLVHFDARGTGLSQRGDLQPSADTLIADLEAVVHECALDTFALGGIVLGAATSILYAARNPENVTHLVLIGTALRGTDLYTHEALAPLLTMARSNWPMASVLASNLSTGAVGEVARREDERYVLQATDGETFARLLELSYSLDLSDVVPNVLSPTLVMHQRDDRVIPVGHARALAAALPESRFLLFDGDSNVPWHGGATQQMLDAVIEFCGLRPRAEPLAAASALCTILFTDVEGSTALTERLGDASARDILREHERVVREQLAGYGGSEVKALGDGFMASFLSTSRALECAVAIQRALADASHADAVRVRIGLNAGEPIEEDADLFGSTVNKAARVASAATGGQILVTNVVKELAEGKRFTFVDRGETSLRGFEGLARLYELLWRE